MTKRIAMYALAAAACLTAGRYSSSLFAREDKPAAPAMDKDAAMKEMMELGTPGPEHEKLAKSVGKWTYDMTMKMDKDGPEEKGTGQSEITAVLGGRFIKQTTTSQMMGMPYEGAGYVGYDKMKKQFISTWMDNMSTSAMLAYGDSSDGGKSITYKTEVDCPMSPTKKAPFRFVWTGISDDEYTMDFYVDQGAGEYKTMSMHYKRVK